MKESGSAPNPAHALALLLHELEDTHMPFGKYGPAHYPPKGVPVYDLPYEYLAWFARKGFPKGKLGKLLEFIYRAKQDGADAIFEPLREGAGGRTGLRKTRRRHWNFENGEVDDADIGNRA